MEFKEGEIVRSIYVERSKDNPTFEIVGVESVLGVVGYWVCNRGSSRRQWAPSKWFFPHDRRFMIVELEITNNEF